MNGKFCIAVESVFPGEELYFWMYLEGHQTKIELLDRETPVYFPYNPSGNLFNNDKKILPNPDHEMIAKYPNMVEKVIDVYFGSGKKQEKKYPFLKGLLKFIDATKLFEKSKRQATSIFVEDFEEETNLVTKYGSSKKKLRGERVLKSGQKSTRTDERHVNNRTLVTENRLLVEKEEKRKKSRKKKKKKRRSFGFFMCCCGPAGGKKKIEKLPQKENRGKEYLD